MAAGGLTAASAEKVRCPQCCSSDLARYQYGEPAVNADLDTLIRARRVALGGCLVGESDSVYRCNVCWSDFVTPDVAPMPTSSALETFPVSLAPDSDGQPHWTVGRLVLTGSAAPEKPRPNPRVVLETAFLELVHRDQYVRYLVTPAGFLRAATGPTVRVTHGWNTTQPDFDALRQAAEDIALRNLSGVLEVARGHVTYLVVGVDVHLTGDEPYAEVALVIEVEEEKVVAWTGKSYPKTGKQERELVRNASVGNHVMEVAGERVAVLVCHDLVAWTGRSANVRRGCRAGVASELTKAIAVARPSIVVHLPHTVERTQTWVAGWNALKDQTGTDVGIWASAIAFLTSRWRKPKKTRLAAVRDRTRSSSGDVLDIIVGE